LLWYFIINYSHYLSLRQCLTDPKQFKFYEYTSITSVPQNNKGMEIIFHYSVINGFNVQLERRDNINR